MKPRGCLFIILQRRNCQKTQQHKLKFLGNFLLLLISHVYGSDFFSLLKNLFSHCLSLVVGAAATFFCSRSWARKKRLRKKEVQH
jgi:hypothetical protein